jgi:hypothetical protein
MIDTQRNWFLGALLLGAAAATAQQQPPAADTPAALQEFEALSKDYAKAQQAHSAEVRKAVEAAKAAGLPAPERTAGPAAEWLPKFQAGADKYKGTDGAVPFLVWLGNNRRGAERDAVLATLLGDHLKSPELGRALPLLLSAGMPPGPRLINMTGAPATPAPSTEEQQKNEARVQEMLAKVIAGNPHGDVVAKTLLARANLVLQARGRTFDDAAKLRALDDVRQARQRGTQAELLTQCDGILFEAERLAIGLVAPDIEGPDLDGVPFKLSDYRGKVVLLDYWGDW